MVDAQSSKQLWEILETAFASPSTSRIVNLHFDLQECKQNDDSVSKYLYRAKAIWDQLAAAGSPMSMKEFIVNVFKGIRPEYHTVMATIDARPETVTFSTLLGLLLNQELLYQKTNSQISSVVPSPTTIIDSSVSPSANLAQKNNSTGSRQFHGYNKKNFRQNGNNRGRTFNNNLNGNFRGHNFNNHQNATQGFRTDRGPKCQICFHFNHTAANCDQRYNHAQLSSANIASFYQSASPIHQWLPDTGATHHATPDIASLSRADSYTGNDTLQVGNGNGLNIKHVGSTSFISNSSNFVLNDILHVPSLTKSLLSVNKFTTDNDVFFEFHPTYFVVKDRKSGRALLSGPSKHGMYQFSTSIFSSPPSPSAFLSAKASSDRWHNRLGHPHSRVLHQILRDNKLPVSIHNMTLCHACQLGKASRLHLPLTNNRVTSVLELLYSDVWGPSPYLSMEGHKYFVLFIDAYSKFIWFYPMQNKSDVFPIFKKFQLFVERQFGCKIKSIQTDWGGEYRKLSTFFESIGIFHRLACPHTHEQNGMVERRNRHIVETGITLLANSCLPFKYWHFAFDTAVFLINRMPSTVSNSKSPFECIYAKPPDYSFLKVFGCLCYPLLRPYNSHKVDFRSSPCLFLGYSSSHVGYRCLDLKTNRFYIARHVRFNEDYFPYSQLHSQLNPSAVSQSVSSPWAIVTTSHTPFVADHTRSTGAISPTAVTPTTSAHHPLSTLTPINSPQPMPMPIP